VRLQQGHFTMHV